MDRSFLVDDNAVTVHFDGLSLDLHNTYDLVAMQRPTWSTLVLRWRPNRWANPDSPAEVVLTVTGIHWILDVPGGREDNADCLAIIGFLFGACPLDVRSSYTGQQWISGDHLVLEFENGRWLRLDAARAVLHVAGGHPIGV